MEREAEHFPVEFFRDGKGQFAKAGKSPLVMGWHGIVDCGAYAPVVKVSPQRLAITCADDEEMPHV